MDAEDFDQFLEETDPLTEVATKRHFIEALAGAISRDETVGVVMCDLVRFKRFNDRHGHVAGDYVLLGVARRLERLIGNDGLVGRYGGEEFVILLLGEAVESMDQIALRLQTALANEPVRLVRPELGNGPVPVELHVGSAVAEPGMDANAVIRAADEDLQRNWQLRRERERQRHPRTPES